MMPTSKSQQTSDCSSDLALGYWIQHPGLAQAG